MSVSFAVGARAHPAVAARGSTTATVRRAAVASSSSTLSARRSVALSSRVPTLITRSARAPRSGTRSNAVVVRAMATADTEVTAETVVRGMYDAINRRDVEAALAFVDDDILYEDFNFPTPFKGIGAVRKLFEESCDGIPDDMLFIVDECTDGGGGSVGMTWYVELEGEPFPNARGASFYRINPENGKLVYARDVVEPPFKLGDVSFSIIRAVAPAVKQQLRKKREAREAETGGVKIEIDQSSKASSINASVDEPGNGVAAAGLYALGAVYWFVLLLSPPGWQGLPGEPAWAVATDTLNEVIAESTDFFFVLPVLNKFGDRAPRTRAGGAPGHLGRLQLRRGVHLHAPPADADDAERAGFAHGQGVVRRHVPHQRAHATVLGRESRAAGVYGVGEGQGGWDRGGHRGGCARGERRPLQGVRAHRPRHRRPVCVLGVVRGPGGGRGLGSAV